MAILLRSLKDVLDAAMAHVSQNPGHEIISTDDPKTVTVGFACRTCSSDPWCCGLSLVKISANLVPLIRTMAGRKTLAEQLTAGTYFFPTPTLPPTPAPKVRSSGTTVRVEPLDISNWKAWAKPFDSSHCPCGIPRDICDYHKD
jgi:hypothetical protein